MGKIISSSDPNEILRQVPEELRELVAMVMEASLKSLIFDQPETRELVKRLSGLKMYDRPDATAEELRKAAKESLAFVSLFLLSLPTADLNLGFALDSLIRALVDVEDGISVPWLKGPE